MKFSCILFECFMVYKCWMIVDILECGLIVVWGNNGLGKFLIFEVVCYVLWGKLLCGKMCWFNIKDGLFVGVVLGNGLKVMWKCENNWSYVEIV